MRVGKIHEYAGAASINSSTSVVPIPDNANYTTVFKSSHTGYYYERLSTGQIRKITCCQNELNYSANIYQAGVAAPTVNELSNDFAAPVLSYVAQGIYDLSFANANFAEATTSVILGNPTPSVGFARARIQNVSTIRVRSYDSVLALADDILDGVSLIITRHD